MSIEILGYCMTAFLALFAVVMAVGTAVDAYREWRDRRHELRYMRRRAGR